VPAKSLDIIGGLALLSLVGMALPSLAQSPTPTGQGPSSSLPGAHPRIEVNPRRLLYRRCTDEYVIQHRPSGTVLFPERHCWWVRG
jgi:hypothetical protein